jgi:N-methylhydantoinase A
MVVSYKIGIDVGGTFTDLVLVDEKNNRELYKVPSTGIDIAGPSKGVINGIREMAQVRNLKLEQFLPQVETIVHGTTITTNAVLTRSYVKTGLITTKGFRDELALRRGNKPHCYDSKESPPIPVVPRYLRRVVEERIDCEGKEFIPLNEADVYSAVEVFKKEKVEAIAVNFLFSFINPSHERRVKEILERELPGIYVSLSSDVLPQIRSYERGSTTVFNACVGPILRRYIKDILKALGEQGFKGILLIMQSNGGMMSPEVAMDFAVNTLLSGPAGGPKAGILYGDTHNLTNIITTDMGGTSYEACLIRNREPIITFENEVAMFTTAVPSLAIHTVGAGGGSLAYIDSGILRVGPKSAGAMPGPACYGKGNDTPTVTDADIVLGHLNPEYFLAGKMKIYPEKSWEAIDKKIANPLSLDTKKAAYGIYTIINKNMAQAIRVASVEKGFDPRLCLLIAAGGGGPTHTCDIAKELEMPLILAPKDSSHFCAMGMLASNVRHDFVKVCQMLIKDDRLDTGAINTGYNEMRSKAMATLKKEGISSQKVKLTLSCDLRYEGQFNEIEVTTPLSSDGAFTIKEIPVLKDAFNQKHEILFGYSLPEATLELISLRLVGEGVVDKLSFNESEFAGENPSAALKGTREIYHDKSITVPIYDGNKMKYGFKVPGPAIIEEAFSTVFLTPDYDLLCDKYSNYLMYSKAIGLEQSISQLKGK